MLPVGNEAGYSMINDLEVVISENAKRHKTRELLDN
jgi:hypothetical protein